MIDQDTIERVREANDIVQVLGAYVRLKKKGKYHWGLCPFHQEKTPSFKVGQDNQLFYCFGCGKGGNVFTFLMEHENMSFSEAVRFLAQKANITIKESGSDIRRDLIERLNYAHQVALEYFKNELFSGRFPQVLDNYLMKRRGITKETIEQFQIGLAGPARDGLLKHAQKKDLEPSLLEQAGLVGKSDETGSYYDRFRERLMIPIFNLSSKPIAFGGRTLKKGVLAKYVNSPETPLYHKSNVLYGLNLSRDHVRDHNSVFVVEGYFDVISLWQAGIKNVVASSGTAFTPQQARLLTRFTDNVYLFFDSDSAGQKAALRSIDALYDAALDVRVIVCPSGDDPDSLVKREGPEIVEQLKQDAITYVEFRLREIDAEGLGLIGREKLVKEMAALAGKISDETRRRLFVQETARRLNISEELLRIGQMQTAQTAAPGFDTTRKKYRIEEQFLSLLLHNPGKIDRMIEQVAPDDFDSRQLARLYRAMITQYEMDGEISAGRLMERFEDEESRSVLGQVAALEWEKEEIPEQVRLLTKEFAERKLKRLRKKLKDDLAEAEQMGDKEKASEILEQLKRHGL